MKEYKLIKEYPGSPELNCEVTSYKYGYYTTKKLKHDFYLEKSIVENNSEFWEELIGRSYEVLSLISVSTKCIYTHQKDRYKYDKYTDDKCYSVYYNINNNTTGCNIHSIKRLSDGEVFTVGDNVRISKLQHDGSFLIAEFYLDCNGVELLCNGAGGNGHVSINKIEKVKIPLFTTEDGVDVYNMDSVYYVRKFHTVFTNVINCMKFNDPNIYHTRATLGSASTGHLYFSNRKAAEEYVLLNEPRLSINDVINSADNYNRLGGLVVTSIKNLTDKAEGFEK